MSAMWAASAASRLSLEEPLWADHAGRDENVWLDRCVAAKVSKEPVLINAAGLSNACAASTRSVPCAPSSDLLPCLNAAPILL